MVSDDKELGQVVTFYSFKGGTGRSMALANVAWILAANGQRVLVVDWDLESPGLHRFFKPFLDENVVRNDSGIVDLIRRYEDESRKRHERPPGWYQEYARIQDHVRPLDWEFPNGGTLDYLGAGRQNADYSPALTSLDWNTFYDRLEGTKLFEEMRQSMKERYDVALIDSRTGHNDVAEICTLHLPDTLVTCFTLSDQGIVGAADVGRNVAHRQKFRPIRVLPVPMRVDQAEKEKRDAGRALARHAFGPLPGNLSASEWLTYWTEVEVPYEAFYAYEETLATFGDVPGTGKNLLSSYETLTGYITQGKVAHLPRIPEKERVEVLKVYRRQTPASTTEVALDFGAREQAWAEWVERVLGAVEVKVVDLREPGAEREHSASGPRPVLTITPTTLGVQIASASSPLSRSPKSILIVEESSETEANDAVERLLRLVDRGGPEDVSRVGGVAQLPHWEPKWSKLQPPNVDFTGRTDVMRMLRRTFRTGSGVVALTGMGGIGKTQLALEYAHRFRGGYDLIWWINAENIGTIAGGVADLADRVGIPLQSERLKTMTSTLDSLRRGIPTRDWLLVLDNVDSPAEVADILVKHLPGMPGHILITTRSPGWDQYGAEIVTPVFEREESTARLRSKIENLADRDADEVAERLGDLPLALDAAIGSLRDSPIGVEGFLEHLAVSSANQTSGVDDALKATFGVTLNQLRDRSPGAYRLLQILSVMAPEISLGFVESDAMAQALKPIEPTVSDRNMRRALLNRLERSSLISVDTRNKLIHVHRLLQDFVRKQLSESELRARQHEVHLLLAAEKPGADVDQARLWPSFRLLWQHLEPSDALYCPDPDVRQLLVDRVRYMWLRGNWTQGEAFAKRITDHWESLRAGIGHDTDPAGVQQHLLRLRHIVGNIYRDQARFIEALSLDEGSLTRLTELYGESHALTLLSAGSLAADLRALGQYDRALKRERRTSQLSTEQLGERHALTLNATNNLAVSLRAVGQVAEARVIDEQLYVQLSREFGRNDIRTLRTANSFGRDLREVGEYQESVTWLKGVVATYEAASEPDFKAMLGAKTNLAVSLRSAGQVDEAALMLDETHQKYQATFNPEQPGPSACKLSRAVTLLAQRRTDEALRELEETKTQYGQVFGEQHPWSLVARGNLAAALRAHGDRDRALELAAEVAQGCRELLGPRHPHTLAAEMNHAICLDDRWVAGIEAPGPDARAGGEGAAVRLMGGVVSGLVETLGEDHPDTLLSRVCQGLLELPPHRRGGVPQVRAILDTLTGRLGVDHPTVRELAAGRLVYRLIDPGDPF